jgi:hypothetical protein
MEEFRGFGPPLFFFVSNEKKSQVHAVISIFQPCSHREFWTYVAGHFVIFVHNVAEIGGKINTTEQLQTHRYSKYFCIRQACKVDVGRF